MGGAKLIDVVGTIEEAGSRLGNFEYTYHKTGMNASDAMLGFLKEKDAIKVVKSEDPKKPGHSYKKGITRFNREEDAGNLNS
jgi:hypothetical protein